MLSPNVRRVIDKSVDVGPLGVDDLLFAFRHRVEKSNNPDVRRAFSTEQALAPFGRLAAVTGNALAFLSWCDAFIDLWGVAPPADWHSPANLVTLAKRATPTGDIDDTVLEDVAKLVDACTAEGARGCTWEALEAPPNGAPCLKPAELERLKSLGLLVRRNQFDSRPVWQLEPQLELLRPSVAAKLRT